MTKYIKKVGAPATQLYTSYYYSNLLAAKLTEEDGKTIINIPLPDDAPIPAFNAEQIGLWVRVALRDPEQWIGASTCITTLLMARQGHGRRR